MEFRPQVSNAKSMNSDFKFSHPSISIYPNYDLYDLRFITVQRFKESSTELT